MFHWPLPCALDITRMKVTGEDYCYYCGKPMPPPRKKKWEIEWEQNHPPRDWPQA